MLLKKMGGDDLMQFGEDYKVEIIGVVNNYY